MATAIGDMMSRFRLSLPADTLATLQSDYLAQATRCGTIHWSLAQGEQAAARWPTSASRPRLGRKPVGGDGRADLPAQCRTLMQMADCLEGDARARARIRFAVQQWSTRSARRTTGAQPEALAKALQTGGRALPRACNSDQGRRAGPSVADRRERVRGRPQRGQQRGRRVYENDLFQLIEYKPLTAKVYERPMLFVRRASTSTTSWTCSPRTR